MSACVCKGTEIVPVCQQGQDHKILKRQRKWPRGAQHGNSKLTSNIVREIVRLSRSAKLTQSQIADRILLDHGVKITRERVGQIVRQYKADAR